MKSVIICFFVFLLFFTESKAQNFDFQQNVEQKQQAAKDAADQKTNFKSIVTDILGGRYYQVLVKNGILNQGKSEIKIKSTIYGIIRLFDSTRNERTYFKKLRWARNIEFGSGMGLDKNNQIQSYNPNLTIGLINKREYKGDGNLFDKNGLDSKKIEEATILLDKVQEAMAKEINDLKDDSVKKKAKRIELEAVINQFNKSNGDFSLLKKWLSNDDVTQLKNNWKKLTDKYDSLQKYLSGAPLLTYGYDGNYTGKKWNKLSNKIEFLLGLGYKKDSLKKYDFYAGAFYEMSQDTLNQIKSLNRNVFSMKFGVNTVLWRDKTDGSSIIEAFGGGEYSNISKGVYKGERNNSMKLDLTFSFRISKNLYLPLQIKYNTTSGKFEGLLDLKFDVVNIFK